MLEIAHLHKAFGNTKALDGFDLTVEAGEILGLVGHNGAGKSTLAKVVVGLLRPDAGTVLVCGVNVVDDPRRARSHCGFCPQDISLYPMVSARQNLRVFSRMFGLGRGETEQRIDEVAEALALTELLDRRVRELSGGQQRRVQAATAMVHRPDVLLLDEPTAGADPITRDALLSVVRDAAANGAAVVYTTHYLPELKVLDASVAVALRGSVIARGTRQELLGALPGRAVLKFQGPAPDLQVPPGLDVTQDPEGSTVTVSSTDPARSLAQLLAQNPASLDQLATVDLEPPSLQDLYERLESPPSLSLV